jgi:transposase
MEVMIGIDPHKGSHTAVAIDTEEVIIDKLQVMASATQTTELLGWAARFDRRRWAVESAAGLGYLLSQQLVAAGEEVVDVPAVLAARVRVLDTHCSQKNDPNDARSVAVAALRAGRLHAVRPDDHARVLRLLAKRHRDLGRQKNKAACRLHALLLDLIPGGVTAPMTVTRANAMLDTIETTDAMSRHRVELGRELVADMARLEAQMKTSKQRIRTAVVASGTSLSDIYGCGPICAAMIIGHTGNIERFATRNHFASYNATAPNEASSGPRPRHRVNLRGNRQLNWAIHMIAVTQLRQPATAGRVYYDRKIDEGKTGKEALRCLKRRISDVVYRHLLADAHR